MKKSKILVIDDDVDICQLLKRFLDRKGYESHSALRGNEGLIFIKNNDVDLVLMDFRLPDYDGIDLIKEIKAINKVIPVIVITGYSDVKQAVKLIQLGAFEYVTKPIFPEQILEHIKNALDQPEPKTNKSISVPTPAPETKKVKTSPKTFKNNLQESKSFITGSSIQAKEVKNQVEMVAPTEMTVLLLGESGTGKEVTARMIHNYSTRKDNPFVAVDCGALPKELAGSELFGHKKGAFTGALNDKKGHFEQAEGGTLFLDEIGNLSYENQIKLLRVLQERKVRRIGDDKDIPVNVRIIVATNENLKTALEEGRFREDVFYRINEFNIKLPPLRACKEDILNFANFFLDKANIELNKNISGFSNKAQKELLNYNWPGNIRELKNVVKRCVLLSSDTLINESDLPLEIKVNEAPSKTSSSLLLKDAVAKAEIDAINSALKLVRNNKSKAAKLLGVDRRTLYNKLEQYNIEK